MVELYAANKETPVGQNRGWPSTPFEDVSKRLLIKPNSVGAATVDNASHYNIFLSSTLQIGQSNCSLLALFDRLFISTTTVIGPREIELTNLLLSMFGFSLSRLEKIRFQ